MAAPVPLDIINALQTHFMPDKIDTFSRILFFLTDHAAHGTGEPYIHSLQAVINMPDVFKNVAERMEKDTKIVENDENYKQLIHDIWNNFLKDDLSENRGYGIASKSWDLALPGDKSDTNHISVVIQYNFMRAVACMPTENYMALFKAVQVIGCQSVVARYVGHALDGVRRAKPMVRVALVMVHLAYDIIINIRRWWNGEISGKRCVKNILVNGVSVAAGLGGGMCGEMIGAAIGSTFGPVGSAVGAVVGSIAGGVIASNAAKALADMLTTSLFGLPKSEALENAYNFLDLKPNASNTEINSRYRHLALEYHPDKGGDPAKWTQLQYSFAVLKEARGEQ